MVATVLIVHMVVMVVTFIIVRVVAMVATVLIVHMVVMVVTPRLIVRGRGVAVIVTFVILIIRGVADMITFVRSIITRLCHVSGSLLAFFTTAPLVHSEDGRWIKKVSNEQKRE